MDAKSGLLVSRIAMLIVGSLLSARSRWEFEQRYFADFGARIMGVRLRVWEMAHCSTRLMTTTLTTVVTIRPCSA